VVTVGASLTGVIDSPFVAALESSEPSLDLKWTVYGVDGLSFVVWNLIDWNAVW